MIIILSTTAAITKDINTTTTTNQDESIKDDIKSDDVNEEGMEEWEIELRRVAKGLWLNNIYIFILVYPSFYN